MRSLLIESNNDDETGMKPVQITETRRFGRGPEARLCCIRFCPFRWYHYLSIVQINLFRPIPSHSATESQSLWFSL